MTPLEIKLIEALRTVLPYAMRTTDAMWEALTDEELMRPASDENHPLQLWDKADDTIWDAIEVLKEADNV